MTDAPLQLAVLGSLVFSTMGPIGLLPLFAGATAGADPAQRRKIAFLAFAIAAATLALAVFAGAGALRGAGTTPAALIISAGLILLATALRTLFGVASAPSADKETVDLRTALTPVAFPGIVTPVGVSVLIIFASYYPTLEHQVAVMGIVMVIMILNLIAMLLSHVFMKKVGMAPLIVLGAVFGVLQAAMGVQFIVNGLALTPLLKP